MLSSNGHMGLLVLPHFHVTTGQFPDQIKLGLGQPLTAVDAGSGCSRPSDFRVLLWEAWELSDPPATAPAGSLAVAVSLDCDEASGAPECPTACRRKVTAVSAAHWSRHHFPAGTTLGRCCRCCRLSGSPCPPVLTGQRTLTRGGSVAGESGRVAWDNCTGAIGDRKSTLATADCAAFSGGAEDGTTGVSGTALPNATCTPTSQPGTL